MFKPTTEDVLTRGLNAMTMACDSLTKQNQTLNKDIEGLKAKVARLQDRILTEGGEKRWQISDKLRHRWQIATNPTHNENIP